MGMNNTPSGERLHIGLFGQRNAGKSSLLNAIAGQSVSVVSEVAGTTTDPVYKAMELLPIGPVMLIDTPGFDDAGRLGELRVARTRQVLEKTDIALLVMDARTGKTKDDENLVELFAQRNIPFLEVYTKSDLCSATSERTDLLVSAYTGQNIKELKEQIIQTMAKYKEPPPLVGDLVRSGDLVILVTPIDSAAPKGRLILPQQQTIRDLLDSSAIAVVCKETELVPTLKSMSQKPTLVITDSQAFRQVATEIPSDIPLTSFSILMARRKGLLDTAVRGISALASLRDGDTVLICEGCTHHRQCGDIGSVKLPQWLGQLTKKNLNIKLCSGNDFPENLSSYSLVVHCGGCMLNERAMHYRVRLAAAQGIPLTNYGILIAHMNGILARSIAPFSIH